LIALVASIALMAADVSGKWTFEQQGRNGSQTVTLNLKADGGTLTGTVSGGMGRGGNAEQEISDGKVDGNNISFEVTRDMGGNSFTMKYEGVVSGSEMKLKITRPDFQGGGAPVTTEATAKKQ
jgi:autotransporter translocation and assembly factor TamB